MHRRGHRRLAPDLLRPGLGLGPRLPLVLGRPGQRLGPPGDGLGLLLQRPQGEAGVHLRLPGPARLGGLRVAVRRVRFDLVALGGDASRRSDSSASCSSSRDRAASAASMASPSRSASRSGGRLPLPLGVELLGHGGELGVGGVEVGERVGRRRPCGGREPATHLLGPEPGPVCLVAARRELGLGIGELGLHLQQRRGRRGSALDEPRREQVPARVTATTWACAATTSAASSGVSTATAGPRRRDERRRQVVGGPHQALQRTPDAHLRLMRRRPRHDQRARVRGRRRRGIATRRARRRGPERPRTPPCP